MTDAFDPTSIYQSRSTLKGDNTISSSVKKGVSSIILTQNTASKGVHKWEFILLKVNHTVFTLGVIKADTKINHSKGLHDKYYDESIYCINTNGHRAVYQNGSISNDEKFIDSDTRMHEIGSMITIILDLDRYELRFRINGKHYTVFTQIAKTDYKVCISSYDQGTAIKLLKYKAYYQNIDDDDDDNKCDNNDCDNCQDMMEEMSLLRKENDKLKIIKQKYDQLLRKIRMDESNFMNWTTDNCVDWIYSLDKEYINKYDQSKLRENMVLEGVDGTLLCELEKTDLLRYGIIMLRDRVAIFNHIKRITTQIHN